MFKFADNVRETSTQIGTVTYVLNGAVAAARSFVVGVGNGNKTTYHARSGTDFEIGVGTVTDGAQKTLSRDTILSSSNGGAKVDWPGTTIEIMCVSTADMVNELDQDTAPVAGTDFLLSWDVSAGTHKKVLPQDIHKAPGPVGSVTPNTGAFTTLSATGAFTGVTAALTKATAGDVLTFTNGGGTPKTGFLYSGPSVVGLFDAANTGGNGLFIDSTNSQVSLQTAATVRLTADLNAVAATKGIRTTGSFGNNLASSVGFDYSGGFGRIFHWDGAAAATIPVYWNNRGIGIGENTYLASWDAGFPSIIELTNGALVSNANSLRITSNAYYSGGFKYMTTAPAGLMEMDQGPFSFYTAASGTAGNAVTFNEQVRITHTASASRYITLTGSNGGTPTIGTSAGDLAISTGLEMLAGNTFYLINGSANASYSMRNTGGSGAAILALNSNVIGADVVLHTNAGYFKASYNGAFISATGTYNELHGAGSNLGVLYMQHREATNPFGINLGYSAAAPNDTGHDFITFADTGATRGTWRSNGGIANFSANNVNLSARAVKRDIHLYESVPGLPEKLWAANLAVDYGRWKYNDQTHDDWNHGPTAEGVQEAFKDVAPELTDLWQPEIERTFDGMVEIGGVAHSYCFKKRVPNMDSPLAIYNHDQHNINGAVLKFAQRRIERLEAALARAGIAIN